ncbi:6-bladed beta-propeller [Nitrosopumilus sp. K4]|uniref:6-bladed beta-propeller n=1 Tax=Nitrosopumilus sp. K4 TaxID=2795383 RepID=UPI001BAD2E2D|nr:6-bladed beta-propeller [Nitrosopumilus sp. K4]QUC65334.1 6-bladed beta-propeller [Nitrosopumilus sp. K4]
MPQNVFALELDAVAEKEVFGPNDWLKVFVKLDKYSGGKINWNVTKPDGAMLNGFFENIQASKVTHTISRNAFDNQFGTWTFDYSYKNATKQVNVEVDPLTVTVTADKTTYLPGDVATIRFSTNYYNPNAANAQFLSMHIVDENGRPAKLIDDIELKVSQPVILQQFSVADLVKYNPFGKYRAVVNYYNLQADVPFEVTDYSSKTSIFLGTDKSLYDPGNSVELNIVIPKLTDSSGTLSVTFPSGKIMTKVIPIDSSLTRFFLDGVTNSEIGTFKYEFEYAGSYFSGTFDVLSESLDEPVSKELEIELLLDKSQYRPGETIQAKVSTSKLVEKQITYWFEDSLGNKSGQFSFSNPSVGTFTISHILSINSQEGPWKMYVKYGDVQTFAVFFISGTPVSPSEKISPEHQLGPELLLTIDSRITDFSKVIDLSISHGDELFVLDSGNSKIKSFDNVGNLKKIWGSVGTGDGQLRNPSAIFAEDSFIHVADTGNSRIVTFDHDGNFIRNWGNSGIAHQSLKNPSDITLDSSGNFFVSDNNQNKILEFNSNGTYVKTIESILTASAKFSSIQSISSDGSNDLYLLSSDDSRILQYKNTGVFIKSFASEGQNDKQLQNPSSLTLDKNDYLYVSDTGNYRIIVFDANGNFIAKWGSFGNGPGQFARIAGLDVDSKGNVWVVDSQINRIQKFASIFGKSSIEIPDWIRNNAKWWNENKISDEEFASGIEFMIREKIIVIPELEHAPTLQETKIPKWIKNSANWWADGLVSDQEFANSIEYLVNSGIIRV